MTDPRLGLRRRVAWAGSVAVFLIYASVGARHDFGALAEDFHADEATYFLLGHSLAFDGDLAYRAEDLVRGRSAFPARADGSPRGPNGLFLKRGVDVTGVTVGAAPPFLRFTGVPDQDASRLYYGKAFVYPLVAAPFVRAFGARGFLLLNALLLAVAFAASFVFLSARSTVWVSLSLASGFIFASVMPVYYAWVAPELFNCVLGLLAYFFWLYKLVAVAPASPRWAWLRRPSTDVLAGFIIGVLTFSKISNALLLAPLGLWLVWRRQWARAAAVGIVWGLVTAACFGVNVLATGEANYQGGDRRTCYDTFPFSSPEVGLEVCAPRARNEALGDVIFDPQVFWTNLGANLRYFVVGRNGGAVAYFFPAVFAAVAFVFAAGRRESWQWLVLGGLVAHALLFIVSQPYTYLGSGGSVGNRYFVGAYGTAVFLLPPIRSLALTVLPWFIGGAFMLPLVFHPFEHSVRPANRVKTALFKFLPVELTQVNDLPLRTEDPRRIRLWYGEAERLVGFQIYYLDDNSYFQEADKLSYWVKGESSGEILIKADEPGGKPFRWLRVTFTAGPVPTVASVSLNGRSAQVALAAGATATIQMALDAGFPYKGHRESPSEPPSMVWTATIASSHGFVPADVTGSSDTRYLGVRVRPHLIPRSSQ